MKISKMWLLLPVLIASLFVTPVFASQNTKQQILNAGEPGETGSITIRLQNMSKELSKENVSLALTRVADVEEGKFRLTNAYDTSNVKLNHIENANELDAAAKKLAEITGEIDKCLMTDRDGVAKAEDLPVGVYLVYNTDENYYGSISPFLVSIPAFDEEKGSMNYDIEVLPKYASLTKEESQSLPQTSDNNKTVRYIFLSMICLIVAILVFAIFRRNHPTCG